MFTFLTTAVSSRFINFVTNDSSNFQVYKSRKENVTIQYNTKYLVDIVFGKRKHLKPNFSK